MVTRSRCGDAGGPSQNPHQGHAWRFLKRQGASGRRRMLAMVMLVMSVPQFIAAADPLGEYNVAVELYKQGRWKLAAESFSQFVANHPEHPKQPMAQLYLGLTLVNQADYAKARDALRRFVKDSPQNQNAPQARYRIGECSYLLNDFPAAKTELETYLRTHPEDMFSERAWPYLGDVLLRLNDPVAAEKAFSTAVEKFPKGALWEDAQYGWAKSLDAQKKPDAALDKFKALSQAGGTRAADAAFEVASRYFDREDYTQATKFYDELCEKHPESPLVPDARLNAGYANYRLGEFPVAAERFASLAEDESRGVTAGYWHGLSLKAQGDYAAALKVLERWSTKAGSHPMSEAIRFQQGWCARLAGQPPAAESIWMQLVEQAPQGEYADDALYFSAEVALETGELATAESRLQSFQKQFPRSGLRMYCELLQGRVDLTHGGKLLAEESAARYRAASQRFERVLSETTLPKTRSQARYYLAVSQQLLGNSKQALQTLKPLVEELALPQADPSLAEALLLSAECQLAIPPADSSSSQPGNTAEQGNGRMPSAEQAGRARQALDQYVQLAGSTPRPPRYWSLLAIVEDAAGNPAAVDQAMAALTSASAKGSAAVASSTWLQLAETAEQRQDWSTALSRFRRLEQVSRGTEVEPFARRGVAWAQFQQKDFAAAAESYRQLADQFPQHRLNPEARYYVGESWREAGKLTDAAQAFSAAFDQGKPASPADPGAEQQPPLLFVYRSGLQAARTWRQIPNQIDKSDTAYAAVLQSFPKPATLDRLLDEWALLNYEAQRFDRADELFRRLLTELPESDLADNARLSLAESELIANRIPTAKSEFEALRDSPQSDGSVKERASYQLLVIAVSEADWPAVLRLAQRFVSDFPASPQRPYAEYCGIEAVLTAPQSASDALAAAQVRVAELVQQPMPAGSESWYPRLWVLQAEAYLRQKKYAEVEQTATEMRSRFAASPLLHQMEEIVGRSLKQQGQLTEARAAFERVLNDSNAYGTETAAKAQFLLGETYFLQEKWQDAFLAYQKVYASYDFPVWKAASLLQAGQCDEQLEQWPDAAKTYRKLITEFPESEHVPEARKRLEAAAARSK
jgi:cellulose synthase operon protein C